jgi:hypothetical protein
VGNPHHSGNTGPEFHASVQECTGTTCVISVLPGRTGTSSESTTPLGPWVERITGTSPTDLWPTGSCPRLQPRRPAAWHYDGTSWDKVQEAASSGEASVRTLVISRAGQRWAIVHEDVHGVTSVLHPRVGTTLTQAGSVAAPVVPGPCSLYADSWYDSVWDDLVFVGGEPVVVGPCNGTDSVIFKRSGSTWQRIDPPSTTVRGWQNAAVVDTNLWVQGTPAEGKPVTILKRVNGVWSPVPTTVYP